MDKIPFSVYDFFAYLSSGTVLVVTADYIWGLNLLTSRDFSPVLGVVLVVLAYVLFPQYHRALQETTQHRVKQQAVLRDCPATGEGLFLHAYATATREERIQGRLDDFRNQYGFARNMSFAFFTSALAIALTYRFGHHPVRLRWALLALFGGVTLFYRYLKFFRQFSYELFLRYAELPCPDTKSTAVGG